MCPTIDKSFLKEVADDSYDNREKILAVDEASCFFCCKYIQTKEITEWWDEGKTAVCPKCGIDALIPKRRELNLLNQMHKYWFGKEIKDANN